MIKTILVPIGHDKGAEERVAAAANLANKYDAHVKALHVLTPAGDMFKSMPTHAYTVESFNRYEADLKEEAEKYRAKYEKQLEAAGVRYDWCQQQGNMLNYLNIHSRAADLTVLSQKTESYDDIMSVMHDFIIESGMPAIVIPEGGGSESYNSVLVAWDGSKQSAKAVHDALPILKEADKVTVLSIVEKAKETLPEADICVKLSRHGVNAEALTVAESMSVAEQVVASAGNVNADLIVSGAWGHRRLREIIFGGVTKELLSNQRYAIYLAH